MPGAGTVYEGPGTEQEQGCRTGPQGYIGGRNRFLGLDFWAPFKFKNTVSVSIFDSLRPVQCLGIYL